MYPDIFQQLKDRPDAALIVNKFQAYLNTEAAKRQAFYDLVHENIKAEFINGEIVLHSPVRRKHWQISSKVSKQLMNYVDDNNLGEVGVEKVMISLSRNNYEPDIVFFRKEICDTFTDEQKLFPAPDLVVEILSESTRKNDYGIKFQDYAAHDVGEYWIIDPETETIEQYALIEGKFELQNSLTQKGTLICLVVNGFHLDVASIFC